MGGSSARWLLLEDTGNTLASGEAHAFTGLIASPRDRDENLGHFRKLLTDVANVATPETIAAGITGLHEGTAAAKEFQKVASAVFDLDERCVWIGNDMHTAYASVCRPGEGVLIYAGTGSVGVHVRRDGSTIIIGCHGILVDDAGAGFWIGREGLKQTLRWSDELGQPSGEALAQEVYQTLGSTAWFDINQQLYQDGRSGVASLAPAVYRAALRGDSAAADILAQAGSELARLAKVVFGRIGTPLPVKLAGGATAAGSFLTRSFAAALPEGVSWQRVSLSATRAAAELALVRSNTSHSNTPKKG